LVAAEAAEPANASITPATIPAIEAKDLLQEIMVISSFYRVIDSNRVLTLY
jgi:hypothetical protein